MYNLDYMVVPLWFVSFSKRFSLLFFVTSTRWWYRMTFFPMGSIIQVLESLSHFIVWKIQEWRVSSQKKLHLESSMYYTVVATTRTKTVRWSPSRRGKKRKLEKRRLVRDFPLPAATSTTTTSSSSSHSELQSCTLSTSSCLVSIPKSLCLW